MRLPSKLTPVLSAAAALALLTACGGGSDEAASSSSSSSGATTSSSAAETSADADPEAQAFCDEAGAAFTDLESAVTSADPTAIPGLFAEASDRLGTIEPPAEISDSWSQLTAALDQVVAGIQGLDLTTPEGQQAFIEQTTALQTQATGAQADVEAYVTANCDTSATPTS